ncbi:MAG: hypothetical protein KIS96_14525 [Bauldia sp.]|nr:hypothetical protein [Bauldia sp.]
MVELWITDQAGEPTIGPVELQQPEAAFELGDETLISMSGLIALADATLPDWAVNGNEREGRITWTDGSYEGWLQIVSVSTVPSLDETPPTLGAITLAPIPPRAT